MPEETDDGIYIDGETFTNADLTYREQREVRDLVRELAPGGDPDEAGDVDIVPAFVCVVKRRTDPKYTIEQALDIKPKDLVRPTKAAARKIKAA